MKKFLSLILALLIVTALSSCGSGSAKDFETEYATDTNGYFESKSESVAVPTDRDYDFMMNDGGLYEEPVYEEAPMYDAPSYSVESEPVKPAPSDEKPVTDGRKIIYNSNFSLQTKEYEKSVSLLKSLCAEYGGWLESSNSYESADYGNRSSHFVIRVPVENYNSFISRQGEIGIIISSSENNRDVTEEYVDIEARLASATLREERVLKILENADRLDDVLTLERELSDIRYEIESYTGRLRKFDSLVSYSTVTVNISEVTVITPRKPEPLSFSERVTKSFKDGMENVKEDLEDFVVSLSYNLVGIIVWTVIIIVALVVVLFKVRKSKKTKKAREEENIPD